MRQFFEKKEQEQLAEYAIKSAESKGRDYAEPPSKNRTVFQRDRDRIIHSKAFRRLKHKTQVFLATEKDHARSRLTHTIEVAQISRHIARILQLNEDLSESIALAHDLGHTPFGHAGETTLNELMEHHGGFEHNLHSLRIVEKLEKKYPKFPGLNLTYELKEGLKKHQTPWDHPATVESTFVTLESQVVNVADEISYNNHDIDDGLASKILIEEELESMVTLWRDAKREIKKKYTGLTNDELKHVINSHLISEQVENIVTTTQKNIKEAGIETLEDVQQYKKNIVQFSDEKRAQSDELRAYLHNKLYTQYHVYRMNKKGQLIIRDLFNAFTQDIQILPEEHQKKIAKTTPKQQVISDYIAGMTDSYAQKEHQMIFN